MPEFTELFEKIEYKFADPGILRLALSHRSSGYLNNERLEFLGDSILGFIIAEALYSRYPEASEGDLSRMRSELVQKPTLADIARQLDIGSFLILGSGEIKSGGATRESILADAMEALVSAVYLDSDLQVCRSRVLKWFAGRMQQLKPEMSYKDPKTRLQEYLQSLKEKLPEYQVLEVTGQDHEQTFTVHCEVSLLKEAIKGYGNSRREAEQCAAEGALKTLGQHRG